MEQEEAIDAAHQDPYLTTHPLTPDRIAFVKDHLARSPYKDAQLPSGFDSGFDMVKAKLDGFLDSPGPTYRAYAAKETTPAVRYARVVLSHRMGDEAGSLRLLDGLIAEQPSSPWLQELKGQVLFESGSGRAALAPYQQAVRLAPDQPLIRQSLAHVMIESNDPALLRPAIDHLQTALRYDREDDETWHWLGVAWGRLGNLGEANLALAEEAMLQNDIRSARRFAQEAAGALPPGPSKLRALDISNAVKRENRT
ncbi:MAG: tetratricopeptide repeat protein, partial [Acetobacteraceae bacterium]|nr:tetratricopeptide repeat protein [Acetobacteraceae bacterium]